MVAIIRFQIDHGTVWYQMMQFPKSRLYATEVKYGFLLLSSLHGARKLGSTSALLNNIDKYVKKAKI